MGPTRPPVGESRLAGRRRHLAAAFYPLAWALLLAGVVDGFSDNWVHAVFLIVAAGAVWADLWARTAGHPGRPSVALLRGSDAGPRSRRRARWATVVALGLYAIAAGSLQAYTWPMTIAVALPAAVGLVLAWRGPLRERPVPPAVGVRSAVAWWSVLVVGGLWELAALLMQPSLLQGSADHPTLSFLMESVLANPTGRVITVATWLALGVFLLARAPDDRPSEEIDDLA